MACSSNPYEHYNPPQVEDDDLIDPDDGMRRLVLLSGSFQSWASEAMLTYFQQILMTSMTLFNLHPRGHLSQGPLARESKATGASFG